MSNLYLVQQVLCLQSIPQSGSTFTIMFGYYVWIRCSSLGLVSYDVTFSLAEKRISHYCLQHMPYGTASQALGWDPFVGRRQIFIEPFVFYFLYFTHKKVNNAAQSNTHTL